MSVSRSRYSDLRKLTPRELNVMTCCKNKQLNFRYAQRVARLMKENKEPSNTAIAREEGGDQIDVYNLRRPQLVGNIRRWLDLGDFQQVIKDQGHTCRVLSLEKPNQVG